jgi:1-acyl-sn-glycerol-3-phosphate acyltransferase
MSVSPIFAADSYETPANAPRPALARLLGWTRLPFHWYALRAVLSGRAAAQRGEFSCAQFLACSEAVVRAVEGCGGRFEVTGLNHLAASGGPVVVVGNHMSFLETFAMPAMILPRRPVSFVVKKSLLEHPGLGGILKAQEPVALTRTNPREDLRTILTEGVQRLQAGRHLCVYPQSTRHFDFVEAMFSSIGAKVAQRAGCPIVPVALRTDFLENGMLIKDMGPIHPDRVVHFAFGPPIASSDARQAQQQVVEFIVSHLSAWGVPCHRASARGAPPDGSHGAPEA